MGMAIFIVLTGGIGLAKFHHPANYCRLSARLSVPGRYSAVKADHALRNVVFNVLLGDSQLLAGSIGGTMIEGSFLLMNGLISFVSGGCRKGELIRLKLRKPFRRRRKGLNN